jgi:hypothetical protein
MNPDPSTFRDTLAARLKQLLKVGNQNILPLRVRIFMGLIIIFSGPCITYSNADHLHKLAAAGLALGVIAAGILYWETTATGPELETVVNQIAHAGSTTKLTPGEIALVIIIAHYMGFIALIDVCLIISHHIHDPNKFALYTALRVILLLVVCALPPIAMYTFIKLLRLLCSRALKSIGVRQDAKTRKAVIKRILRLIGFASLSMSGMFQFPATLFSP